MFKYCLLASALSDQPALLINSTVHLFCKLVRFVGVKLEEQAVVSCDGLFLCCMPRLASLQENSVGSLVFINIPVAHRVPDAGGFEKNDPL